MSVHRFLIEVQSDALIRSEEASLNLAKLLMTWYSVVGVPGHIQVSRVDGPIMVKPPKLKTVRAAKSVKRAAKKR